MKCYVRDHRTAVEASKQNQRTAMVTWARGSTLLMHWYNVMTSCICINTVLTLCLELHRLPRNPH
eukprot:1173375-Amphidinium_carterae.1